MTITGHLHFFGKNLFYDITIMAIDEHGSVAGLVSLEDILEEILGEEIVDEFDTTTDLRELARRRREEIFKKN